VPYDTCMPYIACSSDSTDGFCPLVDTSCSPINTCRTCDGTGNCYAVDRYPNASIAEYGTYSYFTGGFGAVAHKIKAEIFARGPVATAVNAEPILEYAGGVVNNTAIWNMMVNHIVSIVGWGTNESDGSQYWIVRNSWGEYWVRMKRSDEKMQLEGPIDFLMSVPSQFFRARWDTSAFSWVTMLLALNRKFLGQLLLRSPLIITFHATKMPPTVTEECVRTITSTRRTILRHCRSFAVTNYVDEAKVLHVD